MTLGGPNIYPGVLSWLGVARELTVGTPVNPVITHPVEQNQFEPEDTPKFLKDNAIRGVMADLFYETLGVESSTLQLRRSWASWIATAGFMDNLFGDLSTVGSTPTNAATTLRRHPRREHQLYRLRAAQRLQRRISSRSGSPRLRKS